MSFIPEEKQVRNYARISFATGVLYFISMVFLPFFFFLKMDSMRSSDQGSIGLTLKLWTGCVMTMYLISLITWILSVVNKEKSRYRKIVTIGHSIVAFAFLSKAFVWLFNFSKSI